MRGVLILENASNRAHLRGTLGSPPRFSHEGRDGTYLTFSLSVERLSGVCDEVNVVARSSLLEGLSPEEADKIDVVGEIRSFNNKSGVGSRLVITLFAKELSFSDGEDENDVALSGVLCKPPVCRRTPMGRIICDMLLAVPRVYGRSDYLPCIAWGKTAEETARLGVGDALTLRGRLQSRRYVKAAENGPEERVAFEVSVVSTGE